jgi:Mn-dependent DtxR family transcriptional regulator
MPEPVVAPNREGAPMFSKEPVRQRDEERERRERQRYQVLEWVYSHAVSDGDRSVQGQTMAEELDFSFEEVYRNLEYLASHGYLRYADVGPQVCLTREGVEYLQRRAWRRRSICDERRLASA